MTDQATRSSLLASISDSRALAAASPQAVRDWLLRQHVLERVAASARAARIRVLLVKGGALALTVYPVPASRHMADLDVLVRRRDRDALLRALADSGGHLQLDVKRPLSSELLAETQLHFDAGPMSQLVEVHTSLDTLAPRGIPLEPVFERARDAPGFAGLSIPSDEDHALLIALHAGHHSFHHPIGMLDLALILQRELNREVLFQRAAEWKLRSVMFVALSALRRLRAPSVSTADVAAFNPGRARRAMLAPYIDAAVSLTGDHTRNAICAIARQAPLRDDLGHWAIGVGRYAAVRIRERLTAAALGVSAARCHQPMM